MFQPLGTNPKLEFSSNGYVKLSNDEKFTFLGTYRIANGVVTVTSPSPSSMGNTILEFQIQGDDLNWGGHIFRKQARNATTTSAPSSRASPSAIADTDRAEAIKQADARWAEVWIQDGDTWVAKINGEPGLLQIRGRNVDSISEQLSEADRLNGIQWQGTVSFTCIAQRVFGLAAHEGTLIALGGGREYHAGWNDWIPPKNRCAIYHFRKRNGKWIRREGEAFGFAEDVLRPTDAELQTMGVLQLPRRNALAASASPSATSRSLAESQILGIWQGSRVSIEYLPDHTFKRDGFFRKGMKWELNGIKLTEWNPAIPDSEITPTTPLPGPTRYTVLSFTNEKLVLQDERGIQFARCRIFTKSETEREAAAACAKKETEIESRR